MGILVFSYKYVVSKVSSYLFFIIATISWNSQILKVLILNSSPICSIIPRMWADLWKSLNTCLLFLSQPQQLWEKDRIYCPESVGILCSECGGSAASPRGGSNCVGQDPALLDPGPSRSKPADQLSCCPQSVQWERTGSTALR